MSALNFILQDHHVAIAMDTLVTRNDDKEPFKMTTKYFPLPHINCIICGTGNFEAIVDWGAFVLKKVIAYGICKLNELTEEALPAFMQDYNCEMGCTIYQLGLNEKDNKFYGYVYRSYNNFKSEEIPKGIVIKPQQAFVTTEDKEIDLSNYIEGSIEAGGFFSKIMQAQKDYDDNLDRKERIGIGGIVQVVQLTKDNINISNYKYFDDYIDVVEDIFKKL